MATGVTILGLRGRDAPPAWTLEAPWWDEGELREDPRFAYVSKVRGYDDYVAEMTLDEARKLAVKYRRNALPWQRRAAEGLRDRLEAIGGHVKIVRVLVFEWGSPEQRSSGRLARGAPLREASWTTRPREPVSTK
jgi:hypothetical protein